MILIKGKECWNSRGVAAMLGIGRNIMLKTLRDRGILTASSNLKSIDYSDYVVIKTTNKNGFTVNVPWFTSSGIDFVKELLKDIPRKKESEYKGDNPIPEDVFE